MAVILNKEQLTLTMRRLVHQLLENEQSVADLYFIAIQPRGVQVGEKMMDYIRHLYPDQKINYGILDITFYRDDVREEIHMAKITEIPFSTQDKKVILIDDVLYTGRTIRAALDAIQDFGRPQKVELCVLVDRRFNRELPIQPDYCGKAIDTVISQNVKVDWDKEEVLLY